jgi:hypothetical protein
MLRKSIVAIWVFTAFVACAQAGPEEPPQVGQCRQIPGRCCRAMDPESQWLARERDECTTVFGWCITGAIGVALALGVAKMGLIVHRNMKALEQPKEPWERAWTQHFEGPSS